MRDRYSGSLPWLIHPRPDDWVCWKESQVNSVGAPRLDSGAAHFLSAEYQPGQGIYTSFGDIIGILREAGIPLRDTLREGKRAGCGWRHRRPDLFLRQRWAVAIAGDAVATAVQQATRKADRAIIWYEASRFRTLRRSKFTSGTDT